MKAHFISVRKTARYHHRNDEHTSHQWMIAHGYGMLTTYFSKHFEQLPAKHELIIPEGLHRFYLQGASGRVGASWMTKECREQDILDYNNYLNDLYANLQKDVPLIAFGFSQGVATICRWALQLATPPKHLILWAGVIPPDMNNAAWEKLKTNTKITVFQGDKDPFHKIEYENWTAEIAPNAEKIIYPGGHEIHHDVLLSWVEKNLG